MFYYSVSQRKLQPILHSKSASVLHKVLRSVLKGQSPKVCAFALSGAPAPEGGIKGWQADPFRLLTTFAAAFPKGTAFRGDGKLCGTSIRLLLRSTVC